MKVSVFGLGQFGFAFLKHLDSLQESQLEIYGYDNSEDVVKTLQQKREHAYFYKGHKISDKIIINNLPSEVLREADVVIISVPSHITRKVLSHLKNHIKKDVIIMNTSKALDYETGQRLSNLFREQLPGKKFEYALFAGGTIAGDFFNGHPLGAVIASERSETAEYLKNLLQTDTLRITTSTDLAGVEYASAFKNVIAILTGMIHGLGYSYGSETFILARTAREVEELIISELGGKRETFAVGSYCWGNDMFMSATGSTRNREFGILLGQGMNADEALSKMQSEKKTVEGIKTLEALNKITDLSKYPLLQFLYQTVIQKETPDFFGLLNTI